MQYKIKRTFGAYLTFEKDQVREFTEAEVARYSHLIVPVNESVNSLDTKPEIKEKVAQDLKKKDKIKDCFPVNSYTYQG